MLIVVVGGIAVGISTGLSHFVVQFARLSGIPIIDQRCLTSYLQETGDQRSAAGVLSAYDSRHRRGHVTNDHHEVLGSADPTLLSEQLVQVVVSGHVARCLHGQHGCVTVVAYVEAERHVGQNILAAIDLFDRVRDGFDVAQSERVELAARVLSRFHV